MKPAYAQFPEVTDVEIQPSQGVVLNPLQVPSASARPAERGLAKGYVIKSIVVIACLMMICVLISKGRIFEHYLQW